MINWADEDATPRLLAATVATGVKLDHTKIAGFYGRGANYNSIESRFRKIRNEAEVLKAELNSNNAATNSAATTTTPTTTPAAPKKGTAQAKAAAAGAKKGKVATGRVTKPKMPKTPVAAGKGKGKKVKEEPESEEEAQGDGLGDEDAEGDTDYEASSMEVNADVGAEA